MSILSDPGRGAGDLVAVRNDVLPAEAAEALARLDAGGPLPEAPPFALLALLAAADRDLGQIAGPAPGVAALGQIERAVAPGQAVAGGMVLHWRGDRHKARAAFLALWHDAPLPPPLPSGAAVRAALRAAAGRRAAEAPAGRFGALAPEVAAARGLAPLAGDLATLRAEALLRAAGTGARPKARPWARDDPAPHGVDWFGRPLPAPAPDHAEIGPAWVRFLAGLAEIEAAAEAAWHRAMAEGRVLLWRAQDGAAPRLVAPVEWAEARGPRFSRKRAEWVTFSRDLPAELLGRGSAETAAAAKRSPAKRGRPAGTGHDDARWIEEGLRLLATGEARTATAAAEALVDRHGGAIPGASREARVKRLRQKLAAERRETPA